MGLIDRLKGVWARMFGSASLERVIGDRITLSTDMIDKINEWNAELDGAAPWCRGPVESIGLEHGICREFADIALTEMEASVEGNDRLDAALQKAIDNMNEEFQTGLGLGSLIIKPLDGDRVEFVTADQFVPISFDADGKPTDCAFIEVKRISSTDYRYRIERHTLIDGGLKITNRAFHSSNRASFGQETDLASTPGWDSYIPEVFYPGMEKLPFGYYRNPLENRVDHSPCGVSIFEPGQAQIRKADVQAARLDWEYESGERAVHVDSRALKSTDKSLPKLNARLYRGLNVDKGDKELMETYSPEMREEAFINGLEKYLRQVEFTVGLAYGDLSDAQYVAKTATEIRTAKARKYNRVKAIQENLKTCLEDLIDAFAFFQGSYTTKYSLVITFHDSILTDEETERKRDLVDVAAGIMAPWEYRSRWYGEDEETAKANLPDTAGQVLI